MSDFIKALKKEYSNVIEFQASEDFVLLNNSKIWCPADDTVIEAVDNLNQNIGNHEDLLCLVRNLMNSTNVQIENIEEMKKALVDLQELIKCLKEFNSKIDNLKSI